MNLSIGVGVSVGVLLQIFCYYQKMFLETRKIIRIVKRIVF